MPDAPGELVPRLRLDATTEAEEDVRKGAEWLAKSGGDVERFTSSFAETVLSLTGDISERLASGIGLPPVDEEASAALDEPVRVQMMQTGKKRARRSSAGLWRVLYALRSTGGRTAPDTLLIVGVKHAGARPFGQPVDDDE